MHMEITDLTTRIDNLELNNSKRMAIITGLHMQNIKTKQDGIHYLNEFIYSNLNVDVVIDDYFTLGENQPKPTVIIFKSMDDKKDVMNNKKMLKNVNSGGSRPIFY